MLDAMHDEAETLRWLTEGDPSVAWQAQRDLLRRSPSTWQKTRRRVAREGWGEQLLSHRAEDGTWGNGLYTPKWTSTFYSLRLLTQLGIPPNHAACVQSCQLLLERGVTEAGGVRLWSSSSTDTCVTAMLLSMACYFGLADDERCRRMLDWLLHEQMPDGGWNCERHRGATHSSFHSTLSTLEALAAVEATLGRRRTLRLAGERGREFFLEHQLYRSSTTGEPVKASFTQFSFPPRWFFDVLRGLEHFASVRAPWDERLSDPVEVLKKRRKSDGRWRVQNKHTGRTYFELESGREPSRMNTLRALRVMRWLETVRPNGAR